MDRLSFNDVPAHVSFELPVCSLKPLGDDGKCSPLAM